MTSAVAELLDIVGRDAQLFKLARHERAGPDERDLAPSFEQPKMFERATRLKRMSPTIATCSPAILPLLLANRKESSSACVGCSCAPSPALMMLALSVLPESAGRRRSCGAAR